IRYEGEGGVNSNGGREAGSSKRDFYTVIALLVMVFIVGGAMFAVPAWSQDNSRDSGKDRKASEKQEKRTQSSSTRTDNNRAMRIPTQTQKVGAQAVDSGGGITLSKVDDPDPV